MKGKNTAMGSNLVDLMEYNHNQQNKASTSSPKESPNKNLPEGVRSTEHLGEVIPNALKLTEKLSFSDYSKSSWAFKVQDNLEITRTEKILLDNTWVAFHKKDRKHMIACLNGLSVFFAEKNQDHRCYVLFSGTQPGIYKSWASVCAVTKGKYSTIEEAQAEADQYLKKEQYCIDLELRGKIPEANLECMKKIRESEKELMNLKKQVLKVEEQIIRLKNKIDQLEAENQHLRDQTFLPEWSIKGRKEKPKKSTQ